MDDRGKICTVLPLRGEPPMETSVALGGFGLQILGQRVSVGEP